MGGKPSTKKSSINNIEEKQESIPNSTKSGGQSMKRIVSKFIIGKQSTKYLSPIKFNVYLHKITFSLFGANFPRELIIYMMQLYHSLNKVKLFIGKGHFSNVGAGTQDLALFIVDVHTNAWVALPGDSNGYIIHSPDGKKCSAWCGSRDDRYTSDVLMGPNGDEVLCVNDSKWESVMTKFQTWQKWEEKDNVLTFSRDNVLGATYQVQINTNNNHLESGNKDENWKYWSHGEVQIISHDGNFHTPDAQNFDT
jgi:hypothetical protein